MFKFCSYERPVKDLSLVIPPHDWKEVVEEVPYGTGKISVSHYVPCEFQPNEATQGLTIDMFDVEHSRGDNQLITQPLIGSFSPEQLYQEYRYLREELNGIEIPVNEVMATVSSEPSVEPQSNE